MKIVSSNGGQNNANTTQDRTFYYEVFPSNQLATGLWLESERMLHPVINEVGVKTQNEVVKEEKRLRVDNSLQQARKLPGIMPLALVYFLWQIASISYALIWAYFTKSKFGWSPELIGLSLAAIGVSMGIVNILIAPRLVARFREKRTAQIGIGIGVIAMIANAFAPSGWMLFPLCAIVAFQALAHPALTALMTRYGTGSTQGEVQGFASSIMALGAILAPLLFNPLHSFFTSASAPFRFDGAPLVLAAIIAALTFILLSRLRFDPSPDQALASPLA